MSVPTGNASHRREGDDDIGGQLLRLNIHRRAFSVGLAALVAAPIVRAACASNPKARIAEIEGHAGGRLGVAVIDSGGGSRQFAHRADERFPMCSTFKVLAVAAVSKRVDVGAESLEHKVAYGGPIFWITHQ